MCAILGIFDIRARDSHALRALALRLSRRQRHRGPDWSGVFACDRAVLVHERLEIVDIHGGAQPLYGPNDEVVLAVNGEIYNHADFRNGLRSTYAFRTGSDCEVILALYEQRPDEIGAWLNELNGIFAFALYDRRRDRYVIARDPIGVMPLYIGRDADGHRLVASEMKALIPVCHEIQDFPPGHYLDSKTGTPLRYYEPAWRAYSAVENGPADPDALRVALRRAVRRQLMCDVPWGVLLSGGLDSSIIASLAKRVAGRRVEAGLREEAWWPQLHSFAIGLSGAPDLAAARRVADAIGTVHHETVYTVQEGVDALSDVIYHLETYDVTTVRAAVPMYLMARRIKAMGIKMVLSGEGSDEMFGGYLYFHYAPSARAFHDETVRKLDRLHKFDCLRANKAMAAWGVEARVPFLDRRFLDTAMAMAPTAKMPAAGRMEKHVLREAFRGALPDAILWRQKEQFSDGVGYRWIDSLKAESERRVTDSELDQAREEFPVNTPTTKEGYLYRSIFASHFVGDTAAGCALADPSVACSSREALAWDAAFAVDPDPSGRAVRGVHLNGF